MSSFPYISPIYSESCFGNLKGMGKVKNDNDNSIEQGFIQHSVTLLQRRSGRVVKIQPWTISSFEIEKEHKIGSGGFSDVYKAVFLGTPVALKELSAATSSKVSELQIENTSIRRN